MNISITREVESRRVLGNLCLVPRSLALSGGAEEALAANTASALSQLEFLLFFLLLQLLGRSIRSAANSPVAIKTRHNEYRRHLLSVCHTFGMGKFYSKLSLLVGLSFLLEVICFVSRARGTRTYHYVAHIASIALFVDNLSGIQFS